MIGQDISVIENLYGTAKEVIRDEEIGLTRYIYELTRLDDKFNVITSQQVYTVMDKIPDQIFSIQFSGDNPPVPIDFHEILLGSSAESVLQNFGEPINKIEISEEKNFWGYDPYNYSFVITDGIVTSIKLNGRSGFPEEPNLETNPLAKAFIAAQTDSPVIVFSGISPNLSIQSEEGVFSLSLPVLYEFLDDSSMIYKYLISDSHSLFSLIRQLENLEGPILRVEPEGMSLVYILEGSDFKRELLYIWNMGEWRISKFQFVQ